MTPQELRAMANRIRRRDLQAVFEAGAGHIGGEMSVIDILTALYFARLKIDPQAPQDPKRDRLVLSKGHTALALYVVLSERGFFPKNEISTFLKPESRLNGHPNRVKVPGVETNTGPLGHGLAGRRGNGESRKIERRQLAHVRDHRRRRDAGRFQLGSHDGRGPLPARQPDADRRPQPASAGRKRLADTVALAPIAPKVEAFGWAVREIDGHDMEQICAAVSNRKQLSPGRPNCIVAHTNKGQGISFMTDDVAWHHKVPNEEQYRQGMAELEAELL